MLILPFDLQTQTFPGPGYLEIRYFFPLSLKSNQTSALSALLMLRAVLLSTASARLLSICLLLVRTTSSVTGFVMVVVVVVMLLLLLLRGVRTLRRHERLGRERDPEQLDLQVGADFETDLPAVPDQIDGAPDHGEPQHPVLAEEAVEVLVQEQAQRPDQAPVQVLHLALGHVGDH